MLHRQVCQRVASPLRAAVVSRSLHASAILQNRNLQNKNASEKNKSNPPTSSFIKSLLDPRSPQTYRSSGAKPNLQYGVKPDEFQLITQDAPKALTDAHGGWSLESGIEKQQAEQVRRIIGMSTANAKQIQRWNIQKALETFGRSEADTGSPEVQAAVWTVRIRNLEQHLATHRKDVHNRRAYRELIHKRARILKYLKRQNLGRYHRCLKALELKPEDVEGEVIVP